MPSYEQVIKDLDKSMNATSNKMAYEIKNIFEKHIKEDVYDYYDKIRAGNYEDAYNRTWALMDSVKVKRSRNRAFLWIDYDSQILDYLSMGSNDWKNSIIYNLSASARKRDFFNNAIKELDSFIDNFTMSEFKKYGLKIFRK